MGKINQTGEYVSLTESVPMGTDFTHLGSSRRLPRALRQGQDRPVEGLKPPFA